ncbi:MAG: MucR family transcriptional regulator [Proteobacteria bacterium]|nr:MucR family transcriptional regulator [Pseudomonadota bacterium]
MAGSDTYILTLASQIVTAHVSHNAVVTGVIPALITSVYNTLADLSGSEAHPSRPYVHTHGDNIVRHGDRDAHAPTRTTSSSSRASRAYMHPIYGQTVFDDHLVCMEDGLSMKMLKRHLQTVHGMTPQEYRAKWGLPLDYPMVASDYAKLRSNLALESGLGLKPEARTGRGGRGVR